MIEQPLNLQFSVSAQGEDPMIPDLDHLLDSKEVVLAFLGGRVLRGDDYSIRSLTNWVYDFVLFIDLKDRINYHVLVLPAISVLLRQ